MYPAAYIHSTDSKITPQKKQMFYATSRILISQLPTEIYKKQKLN